MKLKQLSTLVIVFAAGFLIAWVIQVRNEPGAPPAKHEVVAITSNSTDGVAALRSGYERQISDLRSQLEIALLQVKKLAKNKFPSEPSTLDEFAEMRNARQKTIEANTRVETDKLLAAGFTMDRIEWLRKRGEELLADFRRTSDLLRRQGGPADMDAESAYFDDSDIGLRKEIDDDEYTRYRQAVGRPIGVPVGKVLAGGNGATAGIKTGDQIISYNGTRVFNMGELAPELRKSIASGAVMDVEVLRDGRKTHLSAAAGDLQIGVDGTSYVLRYGALGMR